MSTFQWDLAADRDDHDEFIDSLVERRSPAIDIYEALAETVPGIIAHQSALKGGELMKVPQYESKA